VQRSTEAAEMPQDRLLDGSEAAQRETRNVRHPLSTKSPAIAGLLFASTAARQASTRLVCNFP